MAKFKFDIVGYDNDIVSRSIERDITITGKTERILDTLKSTDGQKTIDITNIGTLSYMVVESTDAKITITSNAVDSIIEVKGLLAYDLGTTYAGNITAIKVETEDVSGVDVFVGIYGE